MSTKLTEGLWSPKQYFLGEISRFSGTEGLFFLNTKPSKKDMWWL
jgi:hypothetical protein